MELILLIGYFINTIENRKIPAMNPSGQGYTQYDTFYMLV